MKKFTLIAVSLLIALTASAQRKTWDFTKGLSATTIANLEADAAASKSWKNKCSTNNPVYFESLKRSSTGQLTTTVDGETTAIPEMEGLVFNGKSAAHINIYSNSTGECMVWLNGKKSEDQIVIPNVPAGQTVTIDYETHASGQARGFKSITSGFTDANGNSSWNTTSRETVVITNNSGADADYTIQATNGFHVYSIVIGEGDEPAVEENKKVAFVYSPADGYDPEADIAYTYISGGTFDVTPLSAATAVTLDSLQKFDALVIGNNVATDAQLVPVLKTAVAYEPVVNLNSKLYAPWGYGSEVATTTTDVTVSTPTATLFGNWDGFDAEATTLNLLTEGNLTGVSLGDYFASDDTLATVGDAVAIHQHNPLRNTYIFLPLTVDLTLANQDNLSSLLPAAVKTAADTKTDVTQTLTPTIAETYADKVTTVTITGRTGSAIHYTTDGTDPTEASPLYTEPFDATTAITVKAIAYLDGYLPSKIASKAITIKSQAKTPTITVDHQTGKSVVTLAQADDITVYYNFTGSTAQTASQVYTGPIELTEQATITAFAAGGDFVQSEPATQEIEILGQTADNVRKTLLSHYNTADWYDGSKALYPFTWGKSARSIYSDAEAQTLAEPEEIVNDSLGWKVVSYGQVVTFESNTFGNNVGDGTGYNPATALDANPIVTANGFGNVGITKCETTMGAKLEGEPYTAAVQTTKALQGPFDVVTYAANGNGSGSPEIAVLISTDGQTFTMLSDTLVMNQAQRLYRRYITNYDGNDKVYVRVAHIGGSAKAMIADVYVLGLNTNPDALVSTGISNVNAEGNANAKVAAIYSVNGARQSALQRGFNIVKYTDGTVRKVLVK